MDTVIDEELFYRIALTQTEGIGDKLARYLLQYFGTAREIFEASSRQLNAIEGFGDKKVNELKRKLDVSRIDEEIRFIERNGILPLFIDDDAYPQKLKACPDAPVLLYYKGNADLNKTRMVAVVGTRGHTDYGTKITEELIEGLQGNGITTVSGLAIGIDSIAHKKSIQCNLPTIGVLAHGLDRIYPMQNRNMAREMITMGGLLTEYPSGTAPDRYNFPMRNRIVAGMSDVVVVIESGVQGGAMITAKLAASYNREIAAFPGRTVDSKSSGCNDLIRSQMAQLITGYKDLLALMNWDDHNITSKIVQPKLFDNLSEDETILVGLLQESEGVHIDELRFKTQFSTAQMASLLLHMELNGIVKSLPGRRYRLV